MKRPWHRLAAIVSGTLLTAAGPCQDNTPELAGRVAFSDARNPPPWTAIPAATRRDFDLGHTIFNTRWLPAGHDATGNVGLGRSSSRTAATAATMTVHAGGRQLRWVDCRFLRDAAGRPSTSYGHVLNTRAIEGHAPEGGITIALRERSGRHADGQPWRLREPRYAVENPAFGSLPAATVLKPRIGPALFGAGLLDAVPQSAVDSIRQAQPRRMRGSTGGRFGWQGSAISLVDQTAIAFAREMGLTSEQQPHDDCTMIQNACREAPQGGTPELPERFFHAVNTFQFLLAAPARGKIDPAADAAGAKLFERVGCAACHVPQLPVPRDSGSIRIDPHTDLLLHDLGDGLADRTVAGKPVKSLWRTAPLWGLAHALEAGPVALLHDGRAASIEEAILWHEGQADAARRSFMALDATTRRQLLDWIATL